MAGVQEAAAVLSKAIVPALTSTIAGQCLCHLCLDASSAMMHTAATEQSMAMNCSGSCTLGDPHRARHSLALVVAHVKAEAERTG